MVFYGGSAGGGKTYALLMYPLRWKDRKGFGAVTFRRTTKQIRSEGGLWDVASDLYVPIGGHPNQTDLTFKFASGSKIGFAHMEHESNRFDWQGAQIPLIQFDELTHFTWRQFNYMLSRNRSVSGVPARIRATLNPDPDHWARKFIDWWIGEDGFAIPERSGVIRWFISQGDDILWAATRREAIEEYGIPGLPDDHPDQVRPKSFTFIRSRLDDNQILLEKDPAYRANLQAMTRVERARLLDGNWNIRETAGSFFQRSDFEVVAAAPRVRRWVRAWDQAATEPDEKKEGKKDDPDWTAGVRMGITYDGRYVIDHVERFRAEPSRVDRRLKNTTQADGKKVTVRLAQDPGQAGKSQARSQAKLLTGYVTKIRPISGDKQTRARPFASQVEAGNVLVVEGDWNEAFFSELENFPFGAHDDQVDAAADAFDELTQSTYTLEGVA